MPLLDKMSRNNTPDDSNGKGHDSGIDLSSLMPKPKPKREEPQFFPAHGGRRQISYVALIERIQEQFEAENTPDNSVVRAARTRTGRLQLLLPVIDYVLAVESVMLDDETKAEIIQTAYSEIFGFGPLDQFIDDERVTTVTVEGAEKVAVRYGQGDLERIPPIFESESHLRVVVDRLLAEANAVLQDNMPLIEAGLRTEGGRFMSLSVAAPPISILTNLDMRLHPVEPPTFETLTERNTLTDDGAALLRALMHSSYGVMVVGQPESGKTMTLSAMLTELPNPHEAVAVERTGEMHLPDGMAQAVVHWAEDAADVVTFGAQIQAQLKQGYKVMVLDEVRADEPFTIAPLLTVENPPRLIWSFRGAPDEKRLTSALGMLARRANAMLGEELVRKLFERMPFVVTVRRLRGTVELRGVGEWYYPEGSDSVRLRTLLKTMNGETFTTGEKPSRPLPGLGDDFWTNDDPFVFLG
jgi:Flp pilus assembly CpaF family ATPase